MKIHYNGATLSVNELYGTNKQGKRYLTELGRDFKDEIKQRLTNESMMRGIPKSFKVILYDDWYYKNGKIKVKDSSNYIKLIEDAIAEALGYNDSEHFKMIILKEQGEKGFSVNIDYL